MGMTGIFEIICLSFLFVIMGISIATFIFFIILANKGSKALDIYINKNKDKHKDDDNK